MAFDRRIIAVCGKGGTGKTMFTALTARVLLETGTAGRLLLIDADPAMNLPHLLDIQVRKSMGEIRERIINTARDGTPDDKSNLARGLDYMVMEALTETRQFAVLAMGRTETLGCFCPLNDVLRGAVESLSTSFDTILIDGEAGLEQLNRQVMRQVDTIVVVSDATSRGIRTASIIRNMVSQERIMACGSIGLVFNRVRGDEDYLRSQADVIGLPVLGYIPDDAEIAQHDLLGKPIWDLADGPGLLAIRSLIQNDLFSSRFAAKPA